MARKKSDDRHPNQLENGIRVDLKTLANELRLRTEERDEIASERGRVSQRLKEADEAVMHATAAIVAASRPGQMPLIPPTAKADDAADIDDVDPATPANAARETISVVDGKTGAVTSTEITYEKVPSAEDPTLCVCGWEMASPIPGHDRRHHQYVKALADDAAAAEGHAEPKRVYREKSPVSSRARKPAAKKPAAKKKTVRR